MGIRKTALATLGGLALTFGACSTEGTAPTSEPTPTAAPATVDTTSTSAGSAAIARLSNAQYDNAVKELLGVPDVQPSTFPVDSTAGDHFEQYFDAADALGEQVFANPLLVNRLLSCTPSEDTACTRQIVASFASRAYRGPMSNAEVDRLTQLATDAVALGETPVNSIKQVVKTVLASPQFIYTVAPTAL
jgi:hypothetical protein